MLNFFFVLLHLLAVNKRRRWHSLASRSGAQCRGARWLYWPAARQRCVIYGTFEAYELAAAASVFHRASGSPLLSSCRVDFIQKLAPLAAWFTAASQRVRPSVGVHCKLGFFYLRYSSWKTAIKRRASLNNVDEELNYHIDDGCDAVVIDVNSMNQLFYYSIDD